MSPAEESSSDTSGSTFVSDIELFSDPRSDICQLFEEEKSIFDSYSETEDLQRRARDLFEYYETRKREEPQLLQLLFYDSLLLSRYIRNIITFIFVI